jgi:hypothetical protein
MKYTYSEPKPSGGAPLRPGYYKAEITDAIEKTSKAGNEMMELSLLVEEPKPYYGATLRDYIVAGEKTKWKVNQVLAAIGMSLEEGESGELEPKHVVGKTVIVRVEFEPDRKDSSKEWPRVKTYLWGDRADEVDLGPDAPQQPVKNAPQVSHTSAEQLEMADDDIPF